jgi:hypothetical protein
MTSHESPRLPHRGLTLVEVCLVLALLVVIGALAAPLMEGALSHAALRSAGDLVRGAWAEARLAAMQSGRSYVFRFEPNGSRFQVLRMERLGLPEYEAIAADDPDEEHKAVDILRLSKNRLPDGVTFTAGDMTTSSQVAAMMGPTDGGPWSGPVLFHPDGTTSDATVVLSNDQEQSLRVTLRGLTGISTATDVGVETSDVGVPASAVGVGGTP